MNNRKEKYRLPGQAWKMLLAFGVYFYLGFYANNDTPPWLVLLLLLTLLLLLIHFRLHAYKWRLKQLEYKPETGFVFHMYGHTDWIRSSFWYAILCLSLIFSALTNPSFDYPAQWTLIAISTTAIIELAADYFYFRETPSKQVFLFEDRILLLDKQQVELDFAEVKEFYDSKKHYSFISDDNTPLKIYKREYSPKDLAEFEEKLRVLMEYWEKKKAYSYR